MSRRDREEFRAQCVSIARTFKRSWVEMAEALVEVRGKSLFERWGYESLHAYAQEELNIKRATVDKLTGSYYALEQHAPHVLKWDGVAQPLPEYEIVDYFAKAVEPAEGPAPKADVVDELKRAVFDEQLGGPALRRRFNPVLHPKDEEDEKQALLARAKSSARALASLVTSIDGLSEERVDQVSTALEDLQRDLDAL